MLRNLFSTIAKITCLWLFVCGLYAQANNQQLKLTKVDEGHILNDSFSLQYTVDSIPKLIREKLGQVFGPGKLMANPGAEYQSSCVVTDSFLPTRRLLFSATNQSYCMVCYERGGKAYWVHMVVFRLEGSDANLLWTGTVDKPFDTKVKTFVDFRNVLKERHVSDSLMM